MVKTDPKTDEQLKVICERFDFNKKELVSLMANFFSITKQDPRDTELETVKSRVDYLVGVVKSQEKKHMEPSTKMITQMQARLTQVVELIEHLPLVLGSEIASTHSEPVAPEKEEVKQELMTKQRVAKRNNDVVRLLNKLKQEYPPGQPVKTTKSDKGKEYVEFDKFDALLKQVREL